MRRIPKEVKTLGAAIRWGREQKRMTMRGLAAALGVSAPFVSDIEKNRRRFADLGPVAKLLDLPMAELAQLKLSDDLSRSG